MTVTVGVIVNRTRDRDFSVARELVAAIKAHGGVAIVSEGAGAPGASPYDGSRYPADPASLAACDMLVCIGGDGTLIKTARETVAYSDAPLLGINLGSLGYLTEAEASEIETAVDRLFCGDYRIEERMMLSVVRAGETRAEIALNELSIGRGGSTRVLKLKLYLNGVFLDIYPGDGMLISTPTGSTAYALSAGGPVIDPELDAISIVPVCPHVIFSRPLLVAPDKEICIVPVPVDGAFEATVSVDGYGLRPLRAGECLRVKRSRHVTRLLRFNRDDFYGVLKDKLFETARKYGTRPF